MFEELESINSRPEPFAFYTSAELWADEHTSKQMLAYHLNPDIDVSSRRGEFIDRSVQWIASHFAIGSDTRIADFGCGPGLYASRLARLGATVTGIDFSKSSIEYARSTAASEGLPAQYIHQDYLKFDTDERFDLILMIMCDFCALSPAQRKGLLRKFQSLLRPGGTVLLDVYSLHAFEQREECTSYAPNHLDGLWSAAPYYGFQNTFKYDDVKVVLDKYTLVEAARTRTVYNWLQYFAPDDLQTEFTEAGFGFAELFGDVSGSPFDDAGSEFAIAAQKACDN